MFHQTFGLSSAPGNVELATGVLPPAFVAQLLPAASAPRKQNSEHVFVEEENGNHCQWIGLRENLQESPIFDGKIYGFL